MALCPYVRNLASESLLLSTEVGRSSVLLNLHLEHHLFK